MTLKRTCRSLGCVLLTLTALVGCATLKVEPIKVEPIDITLHVYLEADKKLDSFFDDAGKPAPPPTTRPTAAPATPPAAPSATNPDHTGGTPS